MPNLNKDELKDLEKIQNTYYMNPILNQLQVHIDKFGLRSCCWIDNEHNSGPT